MLFHSHAYLILLLATIAVCALLRPQFRWLCILSASCCFYAYWRVEYLALLILTATTCHFGALALQRSAAPFRRRSILATVVVLNLSILFLFKYYGLFANSFNHWLGADLPDSLGLLLPVGISFYTFQAIGYLVDVYRRTIEPERNLARTLLFVSFFPQLVAGPIERAGHLMPALRGKISVRWRNIRMGSWLLLWGLFKKIVIADRLAAYVDAVYETPSDQPGSALLLATYAFAFQIYCDFSGYTDMAIGSAKLFGIDLMQNFRLPYLSTSLRDFWSRWHISLSTWFRDYVYVPLGGNRTSRIHWAVNIVIVFAVSGLWHGAAWTFVFWGLIHGIAMVAESLMLGRDRHRVSASSSPRKIRTLLAWCATFHIVLLGWVFFRATTLPEALETLARVFDRSTWSAAIWIPEFSRFECAVALAALTWMVYWETLSDGDVARVLARPKRWKRQVAVCITVLLVLNFGIFSNPTQFVYFQF